MRKTFLVLAVLALQAPLFAQTTPAANPFAADVERVSAEINPQVVAWRRDFHKHPELGNRETRTSKVIADELRKLGYEVTTGIATTGVVGVLRGGRPGPVVALRADMDALPVTEQGDLPFKSTAKTMWNGQETGVMHACGHDNHMAILLGTATALARMKDRLPGTVKLIFQPAEEGLPPGEVGGAEQMIKESVLENPKVDAIFGLHVFPYPGRRRHLPIRSDDGERRFVSDPNQGPTDARGGAVGRRRSDRRWIAGRDGPADDHQPNGQHHRGAGGGDGRPVHRR